MSLGSANQTNRIGHGVASSGGIAAGQYTVNAGLEPTLETVMAAIFSANGMQSFAPFEVRLESLVSGMEIRTKSGVAGAPIQHYPAAGGAHGVPTTLYLNQNASSPKTNILVANPTAGNIVVSVLLLG